MKSLALLTLLAGTLSVMTGCADPGYTATENGRMIARNMNYEWKMATDDWDRLLLLNPPSRLTLWNVK
jgi:penicillin V acylase-like amidase (Ntn superfamily)